MSMNSGTDGSYRNNATKKFRKINLDLLLASTSLTRSTKETNDAYLSRVTHLHLQAKKIQKIEGLEPCTNLKVLYLYDNQIEFIENLAFANLLQYLYLQNNLIKDIPRLAMPQLKKLFLDDNDLMIISGLNECALLEELNVARQRLPSFTSLQFDPLTLQTLSRSLQVLDISGNGISDLHSFSALYNLRKMVAKDNSIVDISEVETIVSLPHLQEANFIGNPCSKFAKYRDLVIGAASNEFHMLDEISIPKHQQVAVKGLMNHRRAIGAIGRFQTSTRLDAPESSLLFNPQGMNSSEEPYEEE